MKEAVVFIGVLVLSLLLICAIIGRIGEEMSFPGALAEIEQLRKDARNVRFGESEDVIGQVASWNQIIRKKQMYNSLWWADLEFPDGWNKVETIKIGEEE